MITLTTRVDNLERLRNGSFDALIVGGGINGAGVARDLALRNRVSGGDLRVALVEKNHFGSGTSGRNSHLIHGGLRYLKYFDFGLVREALRERSILLEMASHAVEPLEFRLPVRSAWEKLYYRAGLTLYDLLAGENKIVPHSAGDGALVYYDARVQAARLVLDNIFEAIDNGVCACNYVALIDRKRSDGGWRLTLRDEISGHEFTCFAKALIDAAGAWSRASKLRLVRGSHLIFPKLLEGEQAISYFGPDGRIVFFLPFGTEDRFTLVGTTEADHSDSPDAVRISTDETQYLREVTRHVLKTETDPISSFSSLRPLVLDEGRSATSTSREHRIWRDDEDVIRITGGKYTTYRLMSEEAVDLAYPKLGRFRPTRTTPINGNSRAEISRLRENAGRIAADNRISSAQVRHYLRNYGVRLPSFLELLKDEADAAPLAFATLHEMAQRLNDVLFVSTTWGYEHIWTPELLHTYAMALGKHLGWTPQRADAEVDLSLSSIPKISET